MHLPILAEIPALALTPRRCVVVKTRCAVFKEAYYHADLELCGEHAEGLRRGARHRFGKTEIFMILGLAKIARAKQLGKADDRGALAGYLAGHPERFFEIDLQVLFTAHLNEPYMYPTGYVH